MTPWTRQVEGNKVVPIPPKIVQSNARRGLELRRKFKRGGTEVGVARARDLANGRNVSPRTIKRMVSYFARHAGDRTAPGWKSRTDPSAGWIAWLLWGGDEGRSWAERMADRELAEGEMRAGLVLETEGLPRTRKTPGAVLSVGCCSHKPRVLSTGTRVFKSTTTGFNTSSPSSC